MTSLEVSGVILPVLGGAVAILVGLVMWLAWRVRILARAVRTTHIDEAARRLADHQRLLRDLRADQDRTIVKIRELDAALADAVRHVGVVRYDAFREMGGKISFSVALLDDHGNGIVLTVLNGRDGSRAYAKAVDDGRSSVPLSEEEKRALAVARQRSVPDSDIVASV